LRIILIQHEFSSSCTLAYTKSWPTLTLSNQGCEADQVKEIRTQKSSKADQVKQSPSGIEHKKIFKDQSDILIFAAIKPHTEEGQQEERKKRSDGENIGSRTAICQHSE